MPQNLTSRAEIFVVDDDAATREALSIILQNEGYDVICFSDGDALLLSARLRVPACIFLEVRIPDKSGLDTLKKLRAEQYPSPVFIISGQADIPMAVDAIQNGAHDFLEKPFRCSEIIARVKAIDTLLQDGNKNHYSKTFLPYLPGREPLTHREREVLAQIAIGSSNKEAGRQLGISPRTIEDHRANIMKKVGAKNAAELIRLIFSDS
jgi:FixJ family two-component response regulator